MVTPHDSRKDQALAPPQPSYAAALRRRSISMNKALGFVVPLLTKAKDKIDDAPWAGYENDGYEVRNFAIDLLLSLVPNHLAQFQQHFPEQGLNLDEFTLHVLRHIQYHRKTLRHRGLRLAASPLDPKSPHFEELPEAVGSPDTEKDDNVLNYSKHILFAGKDQLEADIENLFYAIDFQACSYVTWDAFTSYLIDANMRGRINGDVGMQGISHTGQFAPENGEILRDVVYETGMERVIFVGDKKCYLHTLTPGEELNSWPTAKIEFEATVLAASGAPQPMNLMVASLGNLQLQICNLKTNRHWAPFSLESSQVVVKTFHEHSGPSGCWWFYSGDRTGELTMWEVGETERPQGTVNVKHQYPIPVGSLNALDYILKSGCVAAAGGGGQIGLVNDETGQIVRKLPKFVSHARAINCLSHAPDLNLLLSGGNNKKATIWALSGPCSPIYLSDDRHNHQSPICAVQCIDSTHQMWSFDLDGMLKVWDIRNFACLQTLQAPKAAAELNGNPILSRERKHFQYKKGVYMGPHNQLLIYSGRNVATYHNGQASIQGAQSKPVADYTSHTQKVLLNFEDRSWVSVTHQKVKVWNAITGGLSGEYDESESLGANLDIVDMALGHRGRQYYMATSDGIVRSFNYTNGQVTGQLGTTGLGEITQLVFCKPHDDETGLRIPFLLCNHHHGEMAMRLLDKNAPWLPFADHVIGWAYNGLADIPCIGIDYCPVFEDLIFMGSHRVAVLHVQDTRPIRIRCLGHCVLDEEDPSPVIAAKFVSTCVATMRGILILDASATVHYFPIDIESFNAGNPPRCVQRWYMGLEGYVVTPTSLAMAASDGKFCLAIGGETGNLFTMDVTKEMMAQAPEAPKASPQGSPWGSPQASQGSPTPRAPICQRASKSVRAHTGSVRVFSGGYQGVIVTAGLDKQIRIWNMEGQCVGYLDLNGHASYEVTFQKQLSSELMTARSTACSLESVRNNPRSVSYSMPPSAGDISVSVQESASMGMDMGMGMKRESLASMGMGMGMKRDSTASMGMKKASLATFEGNEESQGLGSKRQSQVTSGLGSKRQSQVSLTSGLGSKRQSQASLASGFSHEIPLFDEVPWPPPGTVAAQLACHHIAMALASAGAAAAVASTQPSLSRSTSIATLSLHAAKNVTTIPYHTTRALATLAPIPRTNEGPLDNTVSPNTQHSVPIPVMTRRGPSTFVIRRPSTDFRGPPKTEPSSGSINDQLSRRSPSPNPLSMTLTQKYGASPAPSRATPSPTPSDKPKEVVTRALGESMNSRLSVTNDNSIKRDRSRSRSKPLMPMTHKGARELARSKSTPNFLHLDQVNHKQARPGTLAPLAVGETSTRPVASSMSSMKYLSTSVVEEDTVWSLKAPGFNILPAQLNPKSPRSKGS